MFFVAMWAVMIAVGVLMAVLVVDNGGAARTVRLITGFAKLGILLLIAGPACWAALRRFRDSSSYQKQCVYGWLVAIAGIVLFAMGWNDSNDSFVLMGSVLLSIGLWTNRVALTDSLAISLSHWFHHLRFHNDAIGRSRARGWLVTGSFWALVLILANASRVPQSDSITPLEIYRQLSAGSQMKVYPGRIANSDPYDRYSPEAIAAWKARKQAQQAPRLPEGIAGTVLMNIGASARRLSIDGHEVSFPETLPLPEVQAVIDEYRGVLHDRLSGQQSQFLLRGGIWWMVSGLALSAVAGGLMLALAVVSSWHVGKIVLLWVGFLVTMIVSVPPWELADLPYFIGSMIEVMVTIPSRDDFAMAASKIPRAMIVIGLPIAVFTITWNWLSNREMRDPTT